MATSKRGRKTKRQHMTDSRVAGREPWPGYEDSVEVKEGRATRVLKELGDAFGECTTEMFGEPDRKVSLEYAGRDGERADITQEHDGPSTWEAMLAKMPPEQRAEYEEREREVWVGGHGKRVGGDYKPSKERKPPPPRTPPRPVILQCCRCGADYEERRWRPPYCDDCNEHFRRFREAVGTMRGKLERARHTHAVETLLKGCQFALGLLNNGEWEAAVKQARAVQDASHRVPLRAKAPPWWPDRPPLSEFNSINKEHAAIVTGRRKFVEWYSKKNGWRRTLTDQQMLEIREHAAWINPLWVHAPVAEVYVQYW